jgi:nucleoside-diphosphate-sugar epimerase
MLNLAHLVCEIAGSQSEIHVDGLDSDDVHFRKPNIEKARRLLNYAPQVDLPTGVKDVVSWLSHS